MSEHQLKISMIIKDIEDNEEEDLEEYYGILSFVYKNIEKYLRELSDIRDRIYVAQWCNNRDKVEELISQLSLPDYEMNKYLQLKEKNSEINETINFKILSKEYEFLDNIMDMITTDIDLQDQILSLNSSRLKVFEKMYLRLQKLTDYYNPYITTILQRIGYVSSSSYKNQFHCYDELLKNIDDLINDGKELNDKDIDTLLYLCTSSVRYNIPNFDEMQRFGQFDTIDNIECEENVLKAKQEGNLKEIKFAILAKAYGISLEEAKEICKKFNISNIEVTSENKNVFEMYMAIYQIVNEDNIDVLIQLYDEFTKEMQPSKDFRRTIVFKNDLRKAFAHDLNRQVYKTDGKSFTEVDGIKVYDAGIDFKMIVTAIGAYQNGFTNQDNYSKYWNSPKIRSHGNCCSLIGNTNLSMATVKNVIFGFSTMNDNMLLLSGSKDINSTPNSRSFDSTNNGNQRYMSANEMLDNTRSDYNELVYERRDLSSNPKFYKKNPDYIVFIEEYEGFNALFERYKNEPQKLEYLKKQKEIQDEQWKESIKAATDFGIPIVKINREKVAKSENFKIEQKLEEFKKTYNPNLLEEIITKYENNRIGNAGFHAPVREKYFSQRKMNFILTEIKNTIESINDATIKNSLYFSLYQSIIKEQKKVKACEYTKKSKQKPGIDFIKELSEIEQILADNNIDYSMVGRKK